MVRSRGARRHDEFAPVAAEVLEIRSLLSAGAVAAHAAQLDAADPGRVADPLATQKGSVTATVKIGTDSMPNLSGTFSMSAVKLADGSRVTVHLSSLVFTIGPSTLSIKASYQGKISSFVAQAGDTDVTITPTGGSLTLTDKTPGHKTETAKAAPDGAAFELKLAAGGEFLAFEARETFSVNAPLNLADQPITILAVA